MKIFDSIFLITLFVGWFIFLIYVYFSNIVRTSKKDITKFITRAAIFGSISVILYSVPLLKFPVPFFPAFLEFHFDEVPVFIASFAYGPLTGILILVVKTILKLPLTTTLGVGEIADLIYSFVFIIPASIIYRKHRNFKGAIFGFVVGFIFQLIFSFFGNIFVMIPFYMKVMGFSEEMILSISQTANPSINDIKYSFGLFAVLPFNVIKNIIVSLLTILIYKKTHSFIDKNN